MHCPQCAHLDSIRYGTNRGMQRYRCQACNGSFKQTTSQRSSPHATGLSVPLGKDGDASYQQGSLYQLKNGLSLVGTSCPVASSKPTTD